MMDVQKTAKEIGLFETAINLSKVGNSSDIIQKIGMSMPFPDKGIETQLVKIAEWLLSFEKNKFMFLTPEIALIDVIGKIANKNTEVIITVPCDLDLETKERLINNLPDTLSVTILEEPYFPNSFFPSNGMIVICGYLGSNRAMVLPDTYRMIEHYSGFLGKKAFIPYIEIETSTRFDGWFEVKKQRITTNWRLNYV